LRRESERRALIEGIVSGVIDTVVSDHRPHDKEEKDVEFDHAAFGCLNLQTFFGSLGAEPNIPLETAVNSLSLNSRAIAEIPFYPIEIGNKADLTVYEPYSEWILQKEELISATTNTPFVGKHLKGKVLAVINNGKLAVRE
jgi:dihydroorotase